MTAEELIEYGNLIDQIASDFSDSQIDKDHIEMAIAAIHNYINHPTNNKLQTLKEYGFAVKMLIQEYIDGLLIKEKTGFSDVASIQQGGRSISFGSGSSSSGNFKISDTLKGLLPVPFISLF